MWSLSKKVKSLALDEQGAQPVGIDRGVAVQQVEVVDPVVDPVAVAVGRRPGCLSARPRMRVELGRLRRRVAPAAPRSASSSSPGAERLAQEGLPPPRVFPPERPPQRLPTIAAVTLKLVTTG